MSYAKRCILITIVSWLPLYLDYRGVQWPLVLRSYERWMTFWCLPSLQRAINRVRNTLKYCCSRPSYDSSNGHLQPYGYLRGDQVFHIKWHIIVLLIQCKMNNISYRMDIYHINLHISDGASLIPLLIDIYTMSNNLDSCSQASCLCLYLYFI